METSSDISSSFKKFNHINSPVHVKAWHLEKSWDLVIFALIFSEFGYVPRKSLGHRKNLEHSQIQKKIQAKMTESKTWHLEKIYTWTRLLTIFLTNFLTKILTIFLTNVLTNFFDDIFWQIFLWKFVDIFECFDKFFWQFF